MSWPRIVREIATHGMRAYYLALTAGLVLAVSAFLPWVRLGEESLGGVPDVAGLWILGLGLAAVGLAIASIITRKNSRHPLLLVGLAALGILFLAERFLQRAASEHAWAVSQAVAIVDGVKAAPPPDATMALGAYMGLGAAGILIAFGLTIVVRRIRDPYAPPEPDDDV